MQISHTHKLADGRGHYSIGRIRAAAEWRGANAPGGQADRFTAVREPFSDDLRERMVRAVEAGADFRRQRELRDQADGALSTERRLLAAQIRRR